MVLLAIYVSMGRLLASNVGAYKAIILQVLNSRVPFTIEAERVSGEWQSFTPIIVLSGLRLSAAGSAEPPLELSEGRIGVDVLNSLRTGSLQMTRVALDDLSLRGELSAEGKLRITGLDGGGGRINEWLQEFLLNVELVMLNDNLLRLTLPSGETRDLDLSLLLSRDGSRRRVEANLGSTRGTDISILAEGVGDPFKPAFFTGDLYVNIHSADLGAVKDVWTAGPTDIWADGALDLEVWLAWDKGEPSVQARVDASDLLIAGRDNTWQVPLDRVALQAQLVQRKSHWTLFASQLEVEKDDVVVSLPRLQVDAWGGALRVRSTDVPLASINAIATSLEAIPDKLLAVLRSLQPRGQLTTLQINVGDIEQLAGDWEVEANFEELAVGSWKGAPGVTAASGYAQLGPTGGFVILDSQQLSMDFPTIYDAPLHYSDFYGTINIDWARDYLNLSSGLVTAQGVEGTSRLLFGLNIPLVASDVGIEMDLLVGLENSHPTHRVKYMPNVLNESLLTWLSGSIGEGVIEQGAFLWRGSVRRNTAPLRTIQLAFNVVDTEVSYHADWPPVTVRDGIILIDDANVSVWADRANLFQSIVERLSVETWLNKTGQIMLAVDGRLQGPAADGLAVVNDSPLTTIVGSAFADWRLRGELYTHLNLRMNLTDKSSAPQVEVATRWEGVDLDIMPGNLPVRALHGEFNYSTTEGFSSRNLAGELWGKPVAASVSQRNQAQRAVYAAGSSLVEVALATTAQMSDVQSWLNLPLLGFAQGQAEADVRILVAAGERPLLTLESELTGVSLDLPDPWRKAATDQLPLHLEFPLAAGSNVLSLNLGDDLKLKLNLANGILRGGALAVSAEPGPLDDGLLRITGHAPFMQADEWIDFVAKYFASGARLPEDKPGAGETSPGEADGAGSTSSSVVTEGEQLTILIDQLQADRLVIWNQEFQDVLFSLAVEDPLWRLSFDTDWLRGKLLLAQDEALSLLNIDYLDLAGLADLDLTPDDLDLPPDDMTPDDNKQQVLKLPDLDVSIKSLNQADRALGNLSFDLRSDGAVLTAQDIVGDIAGMTLRAEHAGKLVWRQGPDSQSALQARLYFEDLGQTLEHFGYQKILETKKGQFDLDLNWPGPPQDFSLQGGKGSVLVNIDSGSFLEAPSGATGALRVVSILDLADIVRRLSLSHMFESGIPFASVKGEVFLHGGTIEVVQMDVQGGSSFQFSGISDVATQRLEGDLVATLPVANNLPWMAALTASLPIAAGVYVVSKVFKKQMNRISSAVYSISGSWDDPQVKFDHIFDDTSPRDSALSEPGVTGAGGSTPAAVEAPDEVHLDSLQSAFP
jgi:uncharacterized protein (TIGR02099 family)